MLCNPRKYLGEKSMVVIVSDTSISGTNHEKNVLLIRSVKAWVIDRHDAQTLHCQRVSSKFCAQKKQCSIRFHRFENSSAADIASPVHSSKEIWENQQFHGVYFERIDEQYVICFFERSSVAKRTSCSVGRRCLDLQNFGRHIFDSFHFISSTSEYKCPQMETGNARMDDQHSY